MKKTFTILIAAIAAILMMAQPVKVVGQEKGYTEYYKLTCSNNSSNTSYAGTYTVTQNKISWTTPGNQNFTGYWRIGGGKGSSVTRTIKSDNYIGHTISQVVLNHNGISNANLTINSIVLKVASNASFTSLIETVTKNNPSVSSSGYITFEPSEGGSWAANSYYKLEITYTHSKSSNYGLDITSLVFNKTTHTITYNANEASGGTAPSATTHDVGSNATVASNTGSLVRTGYNFSGWNTQANGEGTDYAEGATISGIAQDYTLYAKWTSAYSPNIVVSGTGISSNALNLVYTAAENQTATASFNNMTGYSNPTVTRYDDLACTEPFSGNWFSASLSGSTITYNASANAGASRKVYMRVSAVYNETTYYSNVITITQAALPCTVTYNSNGGSGSMSDGDSPYDYGSTVTVLANSFTAPTGKHFYKWNTASNGSGTYYEKDDNFTITGNVTLHAQWEDNPIYVHITSMDQIIPGAHYILARGITKDAKTEVMDGKQSDYRDAKETTTNVQQGDVDGDGNNDIYIQESGLYEFIISGDEIVEISDFNYTSYTIYDKDNTGYLSNGLGLNTSALNDQSRWILEFDASNKIKIRNVYTTGNYMQFNKTLARVKTYAGTQDNGYLYIKYNDKDCEIYSATTLSQNESYTNLKIVKGTYVNGSVNVPQNKTLTVTGTLTNQGTAANLVIEDGGQLVTANNASVNATVQKSVLAWNDGAKTGWNAISSPVNGQNFSGVANMQPSGDKTHNIYLYDPANVRWQEYRNNEAGITPYSSFTNGRGYLYRKNNSTAIEFSGALNTGDFTYSPIYYNNDDVLKKYNLIGNPYAHNITKGSSSANILNGDILESNYCIFNSDGTWTLTDDGTAIAPGTAILVQATKSGSVTMTNTAGSKGETANNDNIWFTVAGNEFKDVACVEFKNGHGFNKIAHRNEDAPMLYINHNGENFASVDMDDDTKVINLCFKSNKMGFYTLTYNAKGVFSYLHLIDKITGEDVDMLSEDEYTFVGTTYDREDRFIVKLAYLPDYGIDGSDTFAFQSGNEIFVSGSGELQVFDVTGRFVMSEHINGVNSINADALSKGVYVLRIVGSEIKTQKIVVR